MWRGIQLDERLLSKAPRAGTSSRRLRRRPHGAQPAWRTPWPDQRLPVDGADAMTKLLLAVGAALTVVFGLAPARAEMLSPTSPLGPTYRLKSTLRPQNVVGPQPHVSRSATGVFSAEVRERRNHGGTIQPHLTLVGTTERVTSIHIHEGKPGSNGIILFPAPGTGGPSADSADGELHLVGQLPLAGSPRGADLHRRPHQGQSSWGAAWPNHSRADLIVTRERLS